MEGLASHLVVEVHLYTVCSHLKYNSRDNSAHAVHHRDSVTRNEQVFANFAVYLECCLWKVNDSLWIYLSICVDRCKCYLELVTCLHAFDMFFKLRKEASCAVDIIKWFFLGCVIYNLSFYFEFVCELNYCVLCDFHIFYF